LLVQAVSGVTTMTGDPGGLPLRLASWQSQYLAGAYTAAATLAVLQGGIRPPPHIDIAWLSAIATGAEGSFERFLFTRTDLAPGGAHRWSPRRDPLPGRLPSHRAPSVNDWDDTVRHSTACPTWATILASTPGARRQLSALWNLISLVRHRQARIFHQALDLGCDGHGAHRRDAISMSTFTGIPRPRPGRSPPRPAVHRPASIRDRSCPFRARGAGRGAAGAAGAGGARVNRVLERPSRGRCWPDQDRGADHRLGRSFVGPSSARSARRW
jgi:hypothetical protein